jgi:hypothetical protein
MHPPHVRCPDCGIDLDVSAERVRRDYGVFNLVLFALVLVTLVAAVAGFVLVL